MPFKSFPDSLQLLGSNRETIQQQPKLAATQILFAAWRVGADKVVTWGHIKDQLKTVQHVSGTDDAFAAILAD